MNWTISFFFIALLSGIYGQSSIITLTSNLSAPRGYMATTSIDDMGFFAGGFNSFSTFRIVDTYNITSDTWSTISLSTPRGSLAAASLRNLVFFAGGSSILDLTTAAFFDTIDIYNLSSHSWVQSTATLIEPRANLAGASVGSYVIFAGGQSSNE
jgi:hypothetical protein